MRCPERIDMFLQLVDLDKLSKHWLLDKPIPRIHRRARTYWKRNPDQRFGQMLINLGMIPDSFAAWCQEDSDILIMQGNKPRDVLFWGSNYDKKGNLLPETKWRLIKDLDTSHIKNILKGGWVATGSKYSLYFKQELAFRKKAFWHNLLTFKFKRVLALLK